MLLSSVRESSRCFRVCRSTLLPAIICDVSPHSLLLWFYPACCGRLSRCVTPTWADPVRTSSSSGRCGGACCQHQRFSPSSWEIPGAASRCVTSAELQGAQPYPTPENKSANRKRGRSVVAPSPPPATPADHIPDQS